MSDKQPSADLANPIEKQFEKLTEPFNRFVNNQISGALLLILATLAALILVNSPLQDYYYVLEKVEFVNQSGDSRIPNLTTNKVDVTCQFMTVTAGRAHGDPSIHHAKIMAFNQFDPHLIGQKAVFVIG